MDLVACNPFQESVSPSCHYLPLSSNRIGYWAFIPEVAGSSPVRGIRFLGENHGNDSRKHQACW